MGLGLIVSAWNPGCLGGKAEGKFKVSQGYVVSHHSKRKKNGLITVISFPFLLF